MKRLVYPALLGLILLFTGCSVTHVGYVRTARNPAIAFKYRTLAVIPETLGSKNIFISNAIITELLSLRFNVVERTNIKHVMDEDMMEMTGYTAGEKRVPGRIGYLDKKSISDIGKKLGADALVFVYVIPFYDNTAVAQATIRFVDVKTGQVICSTTYMNTGTQIAADSFVLRMLWQQFHRVAVKNKIIVWLEGYNSFKDEAVFGEYPEDEKGKKKMDNHIAPPLP